MVFLLLRLVQNRGATRLKYHPTNHPFPTRTWFYCPKKLFRFRPTSEQKCTPIPSITLDDRVSFSCLMKICHSLPHWYYSCGHVIGFSQFRQQSFVNDVVEIWFFYSVNVLCKTFWSPRIFTMGIVLGEAFLHHPGRATTCHLQTIIDC